MKNHILPIIIAFLISGCKKEKENDKFDANSTPLSIEGFWSSVNIYAEDTIANARYEIAVDKNPINTKVFWPKSYTAFQYQFTNDGNLIIHYGDSKTTKSYKYKYSNDSLSISNEKSRAELYVHKDLHRMKLYLKRVEYWSGGTIPKDSIGEVLILTKNISMYPFTDTLR